MYCSVFCASSPMIYVLYAKSCAANPYFDLKTLKRTALCTSQ